MVSFIEVETFTSNDSFYTVLDSDCFILVNANGYGNCSIVLLSNSNLGKGYVIKETSGLIVVSNVIANTIVVTPLTIKTDNSNCFIDSSNTVQINTNFGTIRVMMSINSNFVVI